MTVPEAPLRRSIEVEYWVTDTEGRLVEPGVLAEMDGAEREFVEPIVEIKTTPCESSAELRRELLGRIRAVVRRAEELDKRLVPLSTPLNHETIEQLDSDRTRIQEETIGTDFQYVRHCAGTHIHFEQQPGCTREQFNTLVALDPALALVNSAQHFRGQGVAAGARSQLYRRLAYRSLENQGQLWPYLDSLDEWDDRLEACYEALRKRAREAGVEAEQFDAVFDPESAVWTPVQLRATFGTVEWRSPDTALPSDVLRLAETMGEIVERVQTADVRIDGETGRVGTEEIVLPEFRAVKEYVDEAIESGLASKPLESYLSRMGFDVDAYEPRCRAFDIGRQLSIDEARARRLEHADALHQDVSRTPSMEAD